MQYLIDFSLNNNDSIKSHFFHIRPNDKMINNQLISCIVKYDALSKSKK